MHQLPFKDPRIGQCRRAKQGIGRAFLILGLMLGVAGDATAQHNDKACASYASSCRGRLASPLCVQLQKRCGASGDGAASIQSPDSNTQGMPELDKPTEMPDCPTGQEIVMVPTCQCATPLGTGEPPGDNGACASCSPDGVRMECQARQ